MQIKTLIDTAAGFVAGRSALARAMNVSPQRITDWANGHRPCPLEIQVRICVYARLTDEETLNHVREAAGAPTPKAPHGVAASFVMGLLVAAGVAGTPATSQACNLLCQIDNVYYVN